MMSQTFEEQMQAPIEVMLEKCPKVSQVFINNRMNCIGCAFAKFHTVQDACEIYQLDKGNFLRQIQDLMDEKKK